MRAGFLLDGRGGRLRDASITIVNGRITAVAPWQAGAVSHDLSRYTVRPWLIDAHVHISGYINRLGRVHTGGDGESPAQQAAGRAANALAHPSRRLYDRSQHGRRDRQALRDAIDAGGISGPRILTSLGPAITNLLSPARLARSRRHKTAGADFIKIFDSNAIRSGGAPIFTAEQMSALCGEAKRVGLRSVVHAQSDASIRLPSRPDATKWSTAPSQRGRLRLLAERGLLYDPQCCLVLRNYLENRAYFAGLPASTRPLRGHGTAASYAPRLIRAALATPGLKLLYGSDAWPERTDGTPRIWSAGCVAGEPPMDALITATSRNASALGRPRDRHYRARYRADLIALEGNPLEEIEAVMRVRFVMKGGKVLFKP